VRRYLLDRLERERDAGLFLCAAEALASLEERRGVAAVAKRILAFEEGWGGVEPHLLHALARMGGDEAAPHLARFLADERAKESRSVSTALSLLEGLVRGGAGAGAAKLKASPRMAGFDEALRVRIEGMAR
jgi:hypothetical protein